MISSQSVKGVLGYLSHYALKTIVLPGNCTVFTFHRVLTEEEYSKTTFEQSIAISDVAFRRFILHIKERFDVISLQSLIDFQSGKKEYSPKQAYACITLDDGWYDNYINAFPILNAMKVPATIFLSTDFIGADSGFWWQNLGDALSCKDLKKSQKDNLSSLMIPFVGEAVVNVWNVDEIIATIKKYFYSEALNITEKAVEITAQKMNSHGLDWSHCEEMSEYGITFGSHTLSHPRLSLLEGPLLEKELGLSKKCIEKNGVNYVNAICYPYGDFNGTVINASEKHYDIGLTTQLGIAELDYKKLAGGIMDVKSMMSVPRINMPNSLALNTGRFNYRLMRAALRRR
ncbi:MAG: polysaccharide deacetylase family protein [Pseudomonadales bacterium]|nr:polysaccharide deacetylase family protein [Pseudomonadales bacterium]